jgi:hypothetical protein
VNPAADIAAELDALAFRAGVSPDDGSPAAARAVCACCVRELSDDSVPGPAGDPWPCLVNGWLVRRLRDRLSGTRVWVRADAVILPQVVVGTLFDRRRKQKKSRVFASVPLPAAVLAAVALWDARGLALWLELTGAAEGEGECAA